MWYILVTKEQMKGSDMSEYKLTVHPFVMGTLKESAVKVLEEASEVRESWQVLDREYARANDEKTYMPALRTHLADEIADVIQAACNLADRYGLNIEVAMERCETRNRDRGRYPDESLFGTMRHSTPEEQELFEKMLATKSVPLDTLAETKGLNEHERV